MKKRYLKIICDRNIKTQALSDLTTKNVNKALFILMNWVYSFVAENWARWLITGPMNIALIFAHYSGENNVEWPIVYMCKLNAECSCV